MAQNKSNGGKRGRRIEIPGMSTRTAGLGILALLAGGVAAVLLGKRRGTEQEDVDVRMPGMATETAPAALGIGGDAPAAPAVHGAAAPGPHARPPAPVRPAQDAPMSDNEREAMRPVTIGAPPRDET